MARWLRLQATRYNYTSGEKGAIVETLAMIRGIVAILQRMEAELHSAIYRHVYTTLQRFVQCELREPLRKATKHRKDAIAGWGRGRVFKKQRQNIYINVKKLKPAVIRVLAGFGELSDL